MLGTKSSESIFSGTISKVLPGIVSKFKSAMSNNTSIKNERKTWKFKLHFATLWLPLRKKKTVLKNYINIMKP